MQVAVYIPHPALQEYVLRISTVDARLPDGMESVITPYPPAPLQSLFFYCNDPISAGRTGTNRLERQPLTVLVGPQFSRMDIAVHNQLRAVRVDFLPGGVHRILGVPMYELFDQGFDGSALFGTAIESVNEQLQHTTDLHTCKTIVESFLLKQITGARAVLPFDSAIRMLMLHNGTMTMEDVAGHACLSLKQFERKCRERIGMNPKTYARILRFSKAYRLREASPDQSWIEIAYQAGYYDQMHMIRDFKVFAGANPSVIEQQLRCTPLRMQKDLRF